MMIFALLAAAAASASAAAQPAPSAQQPLARQATASVRIVAGTRIEASRTPQDALVRLVPLVSADGSRHDSKLVEFP